MEEQNRFDNEMDGIEQVVAPTNVRELVREDCTELVRAE